MAPVLACTMVGYERLLEERIHQAEAAHKRTSSASSSSTTRSSSSTSSTSSKTSPKNIVITHQPIPVTAKSSNNKTMKTRVREFLSPEASRNASVVSEGSEKSSAASQASQHSTLRQILTGEVYQHHPAFRNVDYSTSAGVYPRMR